MAKTVEGAVKTKKAVASVEEAKLQEFVAYCKQFEVFSEREQEVEQIMYAILQREHVLLKGAPGTAKSMLAMSMLKGISSAKIFKTQFTAFMDEQYVFGPQLIDELKQGRIVHNTTNSLADVDFAFLDEFFNANEETIVSCNEVLNERTFTRNNQQIACPLNTAIMTTNQERETEKKLKPIYDRIFFTSKVIRVADGMARKAMYRNALSGKLNSFQSQFSMDDLRSIHAWIDSTDVRVSEAILEAFDNLLRDYQQEANEYISDRKAIKSLRFLS